MMERNLQSSALLMKLFGWGLVPDYGTIGLAPIVINIGCQSTGLRFH